ncbi:glycosyltransferase family 39 protein, partial [Candidatus Microgenomates bacterium]|nr:glycosyltransferase family 39 protein [Candidatus Microgenomates bacterium]
MRLRLLLILIFALAIIFRIYNIYPNNVIIGFDQARDLFISQSIYKSFDLKIIGPTAGNNTDLHHGIAWIYFMLPPLMLFNGNPFWVSVWNSLINAAGVFIIFFFVKSLFKNEKTAFVSAFIWAISFYLIQYSGWLSNPGPTLVTVPLFFWGMWEWIKQMKNNSPNQWGLVLALFSLGLSIQFELFFIYLIPIFFLLWIVFVKKLPSLKSFAVSVLAFCLVTSTMIITEVKYNFSGVKSILGAGNQVGGHQSVFANLKNYIPRFGETFSQALTP